VEALEALEALDDDDAATTGFVEVDETTGAVVEVALVDDEAGGAGADAEEADEADEAAADDDV